MPTRAEELKAYRARQVAKQGGDEYKKEQSAKRAQRRKLAKENLLAAEIISPKPIIETPKPSSQIDLDKIYQAKTKIADNAGRTILFKSVETALNKVSNLYNLMNNKNMINLEWTRELNKVLKFILETDKWNTDESRIQQIQGLASILKVVDGFEKEYKFYSDASVELRKKITNHADRNLLTDREKKNIMSWPELIKLNKLKDLTILEAAIIGIYTMIAPRRIKDYSLMKISNTEDNLDKEYNYMIIDSKKNITKLIFLNYKTNKIYGRQEFTIPKNLLTVLKRYIKKTKLDNGDFLFGQSNLKAYVNFQQIVTQIFKKFTNKLISVDILRHAKISDFLNTKQTIENKKILANSMATSLAVLNTYDRIDIE